MKQSKRFAIFALLLGVVATYAIFSRSMRSEPVDSSAESVINKVATNPAKSTGVIARGNRQTNTVSKQEQYINDETLSQLQLLAPNSLAGITPPSLHWSTEGLLLTSYDSRAWFEFFRSVPDEEHAQSENYKIAIMQELPDDQRLQLLHLEKQYHQLLNAEFQLRQDYSGYGVEAELQLAMSGQSGDQDAWQKAQDMFAERQKLRREVLGSALTEAWYDQDEAMEKYTISALGIARDSTLDESTKAMQVAELDYMLPAGMQETIVMTRQTTELAMSVTQWQDDGLSEQEIENAIEMQYGSDIARRWHEAGSDY